VSFLAAEEGSKARIVVLGDQTIEEPGWEVGWPLAMTDDAGVVAYQLTHLETGKACVAVSGRKGEEFDAVGTPVLSADGATVAYRAQKDGVSFVVVNGRRGPEFPFMKDPVLSADGKSVAYAAARDGQWFVIADDFTLAVDHEPLHVFIGPDHRFVGYSYLESHPEGGSSARVVVDGKPGESFSLTGRPIFSPDGSRFAYTAERAGKRYIVIGDRALEVTGKVSDPVYSPDGRRVGYGTRIGQEVWWKILEVP